MPIKLLHESEGHIITVRFMPRSCPHRLAHDSYVVNYIASQVDHVAFIDVLSSYRVCSMDDASWASTLRLFPFWSPRCKVAHLACMLVVLGCE
jgi:hypothetical protein